ncbi:MAG: TAXI family TRAP transporter solute-binding subunit [Bosea sp. (in: a-proteobacteria)]
MSILVVVIGAGVAGWFYFLKRTVTLQIAVTSLEGEDAKLISALNRWMIGKNGRYRLRPVEVSSVKDGLDALARREVQFAVARADMAWPATVASALVLFKDKAVIVSVPRRGISTLNQLQDKTIGVVGSTAPDDAMLAMIMRSGGVTNAKFVHVKIQDLATAISRNQVQALAHVGPFVGAGLSDTRAARLLSMGTGGPVVLGLEDAEAVAAQDRRYEGFDIPAGSLRARPALPDETISTLAVARHLVVHRNTSSFFVSRFVAEMLDAKRGVLPTNPISTQMDAPDVETNAAAPVHPAASAYFSDEETSIGELITEWAYLALMILGGIGTASVWAIHKIWPEANAQMSNLALAFLALRRDALGPESDASNLRAQHDALMEQLEEQIDSQTLAEADTLAVLMTAELADRSLRQGSKPA